MSFFRPFPDRMAYGIVLAVLGGCIVLSHPFLKIPYDVWDHLLRIASIYDEGRCFVFWPDDIRTNCSWHAAWATLFRFLGVNDIFVWAEVIHKVQFLFVVLVMLCSAGIIFRYLLPGLKEGEGKWLALVSVVFWFLGNGTHSVEYQQAWIMWYSVNYQSVAVPLFWYMAALTVRLFCRTDASTGSLALDILQIVAAALIIASVHPMELLYYLGHLGVLILFLPDRLWQILRKYLILFLFLLAGLAAVIFYGVKVRSPLTEAIITSGFDPVFVFNRIMETGRTYMEMNLSRFPAAFSEAALVALVAGLLSAGWLWCDPHVRKWLNIRLFLSQIAATLLFFLIPLTTVMAGFAGLMTDPVFVWRFFFAAPWFLLIPAILFLIVRRLSPEAGPGWVLGGSVACILILVLISKGFLTGVLYENTHSLLNALDQNKVGPYYTQEDVARLETLISQKKSQDPTKPAIFYLRGDLAYLVRGCLRRYVYVWRLGTLPRESFFEQGLDQRYRLIDIDVGPDFRREKRIFSAFPFQ